MTRLEPFLVQHGYLVLFVWVLVEQLGLPLPAIPALLAIGALAGAHELSLPWALAVAVVAALTGDVIWFAIGRTRGSSVLGFLCRISLEPDSCVSKAKSAFARYGARSLLVAKFVPGLSTAARPLAGIFHMRLSRFLIYDMTGSVLWAGAFLGAGFLFKNQLEESMELAYRTGNWLLVLVVAALAGYFTFKYTQRRQFLHELDVARITPEELKQKLDSGEPILIVDLRHHLDFQANPGVLPGAMRLRAEELETRLNEIPRDRELILYCT